jgi:ribosomal silencing factor RsfS
VVKEWNGNHLDKRVIQKLSNSNWGKVHNFTVVFGICLKSLRKLYILERILHMKELHVPQ